MNLLHMKYAVAIAETNSINKAAEKLYVGQSNLSRAVKELESNLGVTLFDRSAKGMFLTPEGELFVRYAKTILNQVDSVENLFRQGLVQKRRFHVSVPSSSYITQALVSFSQALPASEQIEVFYKETNSADAVKDVLRDDAKLGIIRYEESYDRYYKTLLDEKGLNYELIAEFRNVLLISEDSPLAEMKSVRKADLCLFTEILQTDSDEPPFPDPDVKRTDSSEHCGRRIFVSERAGRFELLSQNPECYLRTPPVPESVMRRYRLTARCCEDDSSVFRDVLIHRREYVLSSLDKLFLSELCRSKRNTVG